MPTDDSALPTLIDWAGGPARIAAMINAFYDRVEQDDLSPVVPRWGQHSAPRSCRAVVGGSIGWTHRYTDGLGGYEQMLAHHRNLAITGEQRLRFTTLMSRAADDAALPDDPEFRAAIMGYLEWGTRLAVRNSQPDAQPVAHAPVPRWGWGVAPPYRP